MHFQGGDPFEMFKMFFGQDGGGMFGGGGGGQGGGGFGGGNMFGGGGFGGQQQRPGGVRGQAKPGHASESLYKGDKHVIELTGSTFPKDDKWLWIIEVCI